MARKILPYEPHLKEKARQLRNNSTKSEILLWYHLQGKQMCGYDFHRQKPILKYIVDFFCYELMLAIEIDGKSHFGKEEVDQKRQKEIERIGVRFLRFDDEEVYYNLKGVVDSIEEWINLNDFDCENI
jgi:very-short-patch-repair endonuclease